MSQQEQTVFRKIFLTVNAETASLADPATRENLTSSEIPSIFLGETVIFCVSLVKSTGEPFPLDSGDAFELCIDNSFRNANQPMAFSGNGCFNVAGDWNSVSLADGKISVRVSCNTAQFVQAVGNQQTLTSWMEIKKYSAGGSSNSVLLLDRVLAKNVVFLNGAEPDSLGDNYYTKAQVDSIMASGLAIELSSANVITSAAVVGQASSVASLQSMTVSSGGSVTVSSVGSASVADGSVILSNCNSFIVSGGTVSAGDIASVAFSNGEIASATNVAIAGSGSQSNSSYENLSGKPSINSVVLSGNRTAADLGLFSTNGWPVAPLGVTSVSAAGKIYTHTLAAGETFMFPTPVGDADNAFELHLTQPASAVSFTLPAVTWKFATPDLSTEGRTYELRFRYLNGAWEGWTVPEMSQYALASSVVPKTGGTFTGDVYISNGAGGARTLTVQDNLRVSGYNPSVVLGRDCNIGNNKHTFLIGRELTATAWNQIKIGGSVAFQISLIASNQTILTNDGGTNIRIPNNLTVGKYITSKGQHIVTQTSTAITPEHDAVFIHTLADNETLTVDTSSLTATLNVVFRLRLVQGATAAAGFTLPSNVTWIGSAPTCADAGKTYLLRIEWDGSRLIGEQEYEVANA